MIEIKNTKIYGLEKAIVASGYPMTMGDVAGEELPSISDWKRADKLSSAPIGSGHDNFLSGILVMADIKYPLYWTPQFQRYHFIQIVSSQSKMHRLIKMLNGENLFNKYVDEKVIDIIKEYASQYLEEKDADKKYELFMKTLSNLPAGFESWMSFTTNYLQLKGIYSQRKNHKLKEDWGAFCSWIEELPHAKEFIIGKNL